MIKVNQNDENTVINDYELFHFKNMRSLKIPLPLYHSTCSFHLFISVASASKMGQFLLLKTFEFKLWKMSFELILNIFTSCCYLQIQTNENDLQDLLKRYHFKLCLKNVLNQEYKEKEHVIFQYSDILHTKTIEKVCKLYLSNGIGPFVFHSTVKPQVQVHMEKLKLRKEQRETINDSNVMIQLKHDFADFGSLTYNRFNNIITVAIVGWKLRDSAFIFLEKRLGTMDDSFLLTNVRLMFVLTNAQLNLVQKREYLQMLMAEMDYSCTLSVYEGSLKLSIPLIQQKSHVNKLEKYLGVLMTSDEIKSIKDDFIGMQHDYKQQDTIDMTELNDKIFINQMIVTVDNGIKFMKHTKRGKFDAIFISIHKDTLYWKEKQNEKNRRSRSIVLTQITEIMLGKNTKGFQHESLQHIPSSCCLSVISKGYTLDLYTPTFNPFEARKFIVYLKGIHTHFVSQTSNELLFVNDYIGLQYLNERNNECDKDYMLQILHKFENHEGIKEYKDLFVSYFTENNIDGATLKSMQCNEFVGKFVKYCNDNKNANDAAINLFKKLITFDFSTLKEHICIKWI
eukprot:389587_1